MTIHDLTTTRVSVQSLKPHPSNPRVGDVSVIAESLATNGQYRPIVVTEDGTILAGNHTYRAAESLGWDTVAVVTVKVDPLGAEAKRIMLVDNRSGDLGRYDDFALLELLRELDGDFLGSGWAEADREALEVLLHPRDYHHDQTQEELLNDIHAVLRRVVVDGLSESEFERWQNVPGTTARDKFLTLLPSEE